MNLIYIELSQIYININENIEKQNKGIMQEVLKDEIVTIENNINESTNEEDIWKIEIPKINLVAPISEGTSSEVMNKYVGHFNSTSLWEGNVGLAAHNRGYKVNYFQNIKILEMGDEIIYKTKYGIRTYIVSNIKVIEDTNWTYLENTNENQITLITCVENKPTLRRCIQGKEKSIKMTV